MRPPVAPPTFRCWQMSDGYSLRGRQWRAARDGGPVVLYLHGIQSHGGWFERSASLLAAAGTTVILPDRRGSGLNTAARGDVPHADRWLSDLDEIAATAESELGAQSFGVVGVSWGGKLAVAWALRRPERVRALLLIAPGLFPAVGVGPAGRVRIGIARLTDPSRLMEIPLNDPALFTDSSAGRAFIAADPLKLTHATARFFVESARLDWRLARAADASLRPPVWLLLAGRERIVRNTPAKRRLARICAAELVVEEFPAAAHTLEFEDDAAEFEHTVRGWAATINTPGYLSAGPAGLCSAPG